MLLAKKNLLETFELLFNKMQKEKIEEKKLAAIISTTRRNSVIVKISLANCSRNEATTCVDNVVGIDLNWDLLSRNQYGAP